MTCGDSTVLRFKRNRGIPNPTLLKIMAKQVVRLMGGD